MRTLILIACCAVVLPAAGCRNVPAEAREELRHTVEITRPADRDALRARLRRVLAGDHASRPDVDPHLRAAAAQSLGELGDPDDIDILLDASLGALRDDNVQVRMEAAIALGKLRYEGRADPRRARAITLLRARVAFERDDAGRHIEADYLVRNAMLNSIVAIGGHAAATALHDVASRLVADSLSGAVAAAADKGLIDRCFEALADITGTPPREAALHRVAHDDPRAHLSWWADRIMLMRD